MCALIGTAFAQFTGQPAPDSFKRNTIAVRDGFALSKDGQVVVTQDEVTRTVNQQFVLSNGDIVYPNGDYILFTGGREHLQPNQLLTLDGVLENTPVNADGAAPVVLPGAKDNNAVGISSQDGITVAGADTFITRNGVMDKVTKQIQLAHGVLVNPDGSFIKNGQTVTLRENQVLGFDGVLREARIHETGSAVPPTASPDK
jgi:hypothetical protein